MKKLLQLGLLSIGALALSLTLATAEGKCGNSQKGMMNNDGKCGTSQKDMKRGDGKCGTSQKGMKCGEGKCGADMDKRKETKPAPKKGKCGQGKCGE